MLQKAGKRVLEIKQAVYASQAFWNDVIEHLEVNPEELEEINSGVQCIFESMEQSITYCTTALKVDSSVRTVSTQSLHSLLKGEQREGLRDLVAVQHQF